MIPNFKKNSFSYAAVGFIFAMVLFYEPARGILYRLMHNCAYPFVELGHRVGQPIGAYFERRKTVHELREENSQLHESVNALMQETIKLSASLNLLERSQELAQFQQRYQLSGAITAKILEKQFDDHEHSFLLNVGNRNGITTNMVAVYKFQLIGKVVEVYECYCKVLLITDRTCKVAAYTKTGSYVGIVQGTNQLNTCIFTYVSKLADITPNDYVISSGEGMLFPEGFALGQITKIETKDLYHDIELKTLIEFDKIGFCLLTNHEKIESFDTILTTS